MSSTEIAQRTPAQNLVLQLRDERVKEQLAMALPPSVTVDKFVRVMTAAIMTNPDIAKLEQNSIFTAMVRSAADGLIPDGKEAAIVGRSGKATYVPMVGGFRKIAAEYGWTLRGFAVYSGDEFEHSDVLAAPIHREARPGEERGDLVAAWAVATHRDGRREFRVMYEREIAERRALATTQNVWEKWPAEMWKKTAVRDLFAELPFDEGDKRINSILAADLAPGDAAAHLYGADPQPVRPAIEAPKTEQVDAPPSNDAGDRQQADGAASTEPIQTPAPQAAPSVPGDDDEPSLENDDELAAIKAAADEAAMFHPPTGQYTHLSLSEILAVGNSGKGWLRNRLRKGDELPAPYRTALWNFARVYAPELYQQVLAEKEASA